MVTKDDIRVEQNYVKGTVEITVGVLQDTPKYILKMDDYDALEDKIKDSLYWQLRE